ncbi:hypothetical protein EDD21DRAFT_349647 [Dissophora ornata]|nr:hypothetical protein EDD21DRAFT_349647 [Dissophora ornata]
MGPTAAAPEGGAAASAPVPNLEIISMDAFERKDGRGCQLIVVVSLAKGEDPVQFELRVYGANSFGSSIQDLLLRLPNTTDVQSIPISWAPTKIIHAPLEHDPFDMAILVAGSDSCVHNFVQNPSQSNSSGERLFEEQLIETHFPVLASFPYCEYCVLSLVIKDYPTCRIVAAGTQNGTLNVGVIPRNAKTLKLNRARAKSHTIVLFAPITTLSVFTSRVQAEWQRRRQSGYHRKDGQDRRGQSEKAEQLDAKVAGTSEPQEGMANDGDHQQREPGIHLLVTCAIEQAWIYSDVNKHGLSQRSDLAECSYHDSILAAHIMDADWDGRNEIMAGTYGRQLMVFKEIPPVQGSYKGASIPTAYYSHAPPQYHHASAQPDAPLPTLPISQWGMTWNRRFATPVYGISSADLNDDGLEELVVTTLNGVSFFLPDPWTAKRRLDQAVERMREIEEMKVTLTKLRMSNEELWEMQRLKEQRQHEEKKEEEKKSLDSEAEEQRKEERLEGMKRVETDTEDVRQSEKRLEQVEPEQKQAEQLTEVEDGARDEQAKDGASKEQVEDEVGKEQVEVEVETKEENIQDMGLDDHSKNDLVQEYDIVDETEHKHPFGDIAVDAVVSDDHHGQRTDKETKHDGSDHVEDVTKASSPQGKALAE